jgi:hypothetical protein
MCCELPFTLNFHLQDKLETLKFMAAHNVSKDKMLAAEITRPVSGGDVTFHLGIARRMENGALLKTKVSRSPIKACVCRCCCSTACLKPMYGVCVCGLVRAIRM